MKVVCTKIIVDCEENDSVDIRCGGPIYLGFDFFVKEEDAENIKTAIENTLQEMNIPIINLYHRDGETEESEIWTKDYIVKYLQSNATKYVHPLKNNNTI